MLTGTPAFEGAGTAGTLSQILEHEPNLATLPADTPVKVPGTEGGENPFLSPDGHWVGYWAGGELRKVPLSGGPHVLVAQTSQLFGASWGEDDRIVYSRSNGALLEAPAGGGTPKPLTVVNSEHGELSHRHAHVLPGGGAILYTITKERFPRWDQSQIAMYSRRSATSKVLIEGGADARYASTGHLLLGRASSSQRLLIWRRWSSRGEPWVWCRRDAGGVLPDPG
jgi:hypothetical protein